MGPDKRSALWALSSSTDWMRQAACADENPLLFDPDSAPEMHRAARRICAGCPVEQACLRFAVEEGLDGRGIWGGVLGERSQFLKLRSLTRSGVESNPLGGLSSGSLRAHDRQRKQRSGGHSGTKTPGVGDLGRGAASMARWPLPLRQPEGKKGKGMQALPETQHLARLRDIRSLEHDLALDKFEEMRDARADGCSFGQIGLALGVSDEAARRWFVRRNRPDSPPEQVFDSLRGSQGA